LPLYDCRICTDAGLHAARNCAGMPAPAPVDGDAPAYPDGWYSLAQEGGDDTPLLAKLLTETPEVEAQPIHACVKLGWAQVEAQEWLRWWAAVKHGWLPAPAWIPPYYLPAMQAVQEQVWWLERAQMEQARRPRAEV
jgi:hypothetical protein